MKLAESFGVNRFTVRMALQKLNTLGLLETCMGDGTYVSSFDFERHLQNIYQFYMTPELLEDVSEFRAVVEMECARLAMKRHTAKELEELRVCCRMSHNELLIYAYSTAREAIRQQMLTIGYRRVVDLKPGDEIPSVNSHWRIYEAVRTRNFRTCKRILTEMIDNDAREV